MTRHQLDTAMYVDNRIKYLEKQLDFLEKGKEQRGSVRYGYMPKRRNADDPFDIMFQEIEVNEKFIQELHIALIEKTKAEIHELNEEFKSI